MSRRKLIGVFATEISSRVQGNLYSELHKKAIQEGYNLVLFSGTYDKIHFRDTGAVTYQLFSMAENIEFAAFVIHAQSIGDRDMIQYLIQMGKQKQIPIFAYDCENLGITAKDGVIPIKPDYKQGFGEGVKHLIEQHHCKDIYMLAGIKGNAFSEERSEMYKEQMLAHGLAVREDRIGYGGFWENPTVDTINALVDRGEPMPEAICCANDSMAIATVNTLKKRGYRVPEDILVTGFDGIEDGKYHFPNISSSEPRLETVADFVFEKLREEKSEEEFLIPIQFYPKESCGCSCGYNLEDKSEMTKLVANRRISTWQHQMLTNMQFALIDSNNLEEVVAFMNGTLDLFKGYYPLFCIRDDLESREDYSSNFEKMRILLNKGFLDENVRSAFSVKEIFPDSASYFEHVEAEDIFFARLIHNGDKVYGYHFMKSKHYSSNTLNHIGQFMETATIVIENILRNMRLKQTTQKLSEMYEQMAEIYIRDTMTGLYNRHGYSQNLEAYVTREGIKDGYIHIITIDMDGMKQINDNYGHLEGDNAIHAVGNAIKECFAQPCICARFGGDEFQVALFTETGEEPSVDRISKKLMQFLQTTPLLKEKEYSVEVSVGQAVAKLSEVEDIKQLEKLADDFMYEEKRRHKLEKRNHQ